MNVLIATFAKANVRMMQFIKAKKFTKLIRINARSVLGILMNRNAVWFAQWIVFRCIRSMWKARSSYYRSISAWKILNETTHRTVTARSVLENKCAAENELKAQNPTMLIWDLCFKFVVRAAATPEHARFTRGSVHIRYRARRFIRGSVPLLALRAIHSGSLP